MERVLHAARPALVLAAAIMVCGVPAAGSAQVGKIDLAPHRAVYDLRLEKTRGNRPLEGARGRILYDFTGNACEGYALQFRQVSELNMGGGDSLFTDLRATTWEEGDGGSFRFNSQNYMNEKLADSVNGTAERRQGNIRVKLTKPKGKTVSLGRGLVFPSTHMRQIIEAAHAGKTILTVPIYDGSETGEKTYDTMTVIGAPIEPGAEPPPDAAGKDAALAKARRWPVRISYFDRSKHGGEQTPVYSISFEMYENGVSRALSLDYNDFVIAGEMTALEMKKPTPCGR